MTSSVPVPLPTGPRHAAPATGPTPAVPHSVAVPHTPAAKSPALVRFVTHGLIATVESYRRGTLPLPRLAHELRTRVDVLATLNPPARGLTRLRWLHRTVDHLLADGTTPDADRLAGVLAELTAVLAVVTPPTPDDPTGAGRSERRRAATMSG